MAATALFPVYAKLAAVALVWAGSFIAARVVSGVIVISWRARAASAAAAPSR